MCRIDVSLVHVMCIEIFSNMVKIIFNG
jgi:hypothetical protein